MPSAEQFLYATILNLDGARYVVRSDPLGTRLGLEPLVGTGTVRLALKKAAAAELHATLVGRDGSAFGLSANEPATVPVGDYRLGTVTATFNDPQGGQNWSFIFSDNGAKGEPKWYAVGKDGQVAIDPIGALDMRAELSDQVKTAEAGEDIALQPLLYTGDGLLINVAYRGTPVSPSAQENLGAAITLATTRRPDPGHGPLGLCLRHLLPGLGPSAPVAARRPRPDLRRVRLRPARRRPARHRGGGGRQEAVTGSPVGESFQEREPRKGNYRGQIGMGREDPLT